MSQLMLTKESFLAFSQEIIADPAKMEYYYIQCCQGNVVAPVNCNRKFRS